MPNRKVSIYNEGALVALILDAWIKRTSDNQLDLSDFMLLMWERFGKPNIGYTYDDIIYFLKSWCGDDILDFFVQAVKGKGKLENYLPEALNIFNLKIRKLENEKFLERYFGLKCNAENELIKITTDSPAQNKLSLTDKIVSINNQKPENFQYSFPETLHLEVLRNYRKIIIDIECGKKTYFHTYKV